MSERDIVAHVARFAAALRQNEVTVDLRGEIDATRALPLIDLLDRDEVRRGLLVTLRIRPEDREAFGLLFDAYWPGATRPIVAADRQRRVRDAGPTPTWSRRLAPRRPSAEAPPTAEARPASYSPDARLRRKSFEEWTERDLRQMERLLRRMALNLATRPSRRRIPTRSRGEVDLRRSFRRSLASGGDLVRLARRRRAVEEAHLVLLCDTSGSMDAYSRFLLSFVLSLRRVARRSEIFVFNTALTRLTPWITRGNLAATLSRVSAAVSDWSGGTKIGECLGAFVDHHATRIVDHRTVVVILSDGLDRGDPQQLVRAMRVLQQRARKVIWINPLMGDPRYEPTARGMASALPFVNHLVPGHNLDSLGRLLPLLSLS